MTRSHLNHRHMAGLLRGWDSRRYKVDIKKDREAILQSALDLAIGGIDSFEPIHRSKIKKRNCQSIKSYKHILVLRLITRYLEKVFNIKQPNRERIVKSVIESLTESTPTHIIRRDIKSFYETITIAHVEKSLKSKFLPKNIKQNLLTYIKEFCNTPQGLPRGISISQILAEISMQEFDRSVVSFDGVYKYARYSDDILIFTYKNPELLEKHLEDTLPPGMEFNATKSARIDLTRKEKKLAKEVKLEYIGYQFKTMDSFGSREPREVQVDIAERKIKKLKTRIICTLKAFSKNKDFELCRNRLRFLSGNFTVYRKGSTSIKSSIYINSGIYHSNKLCGTYKKGRHEEYDCAKLKHLDGFYHSLLKPHTKTGAAIDATQREKLKVISFHKGFTTRRHEKFDKETLLAIKGAWRNA